MSYIKTGYFFELLNFILVLIFNGMILVEIHYLTFLSEERKKLVEIEYKIIFLN